MSTTDHFAAAELARLCAEKGVHHAVISPGSRNAPLVIAFSQQPAITCLQVIDERSAAFFALGMAQQLHRPVALICTSGTAVLNYGPAVAEAFYQRIPLLVISADRPEEWTDQGEGQTIRQRGVLAPHLKKSVQLPRATDELARWQAGRLINAAIDATLLPAPGPVQVNVPFAEPLYGHAEDTNAVRLVAPMPTASVMLPDKGWRARQLSQSLKVMVLVGQGLWGDAFKGQLKQWAKLPQCAVLTEATSNLDDDAFITCIDRTLEGVHAGNETDLRPDILITFGGAVVSKRIKGLLRKWKPDQHWHIDEAWRGYDTYQSLTHDIAVAPHVFLAQMEGQVAPNESLYGEAWRMVAQRMREGHEAVLGEAPFCDLAVFGTLLERMPAGSDVHLANSTAARYVQLFDRRRGLHFFSNRGTSGIDGCTSTAVGAAHATGRPTTLITGDVAFCYDSNAFWNNHLPPELRVVVIDNGGGNIFRYIEGPDKDPALLPWFEAPHGRDIPALVKSYGLACYQAHDAGTLAKGLDDLYGPHERPAVLVVRTDAEVSPRILRAYFAKLHKP
ncbi:MAG: 2-succinyl-5-enolpyruvyl-6-hydroxy-3-cyclohexene-1-carboxylic-acid synthase [Flavobacteriales bacterium]|nr:2-succinyl-5-enolpyruvyl-6-hydroxy-3-cyclohexene-1-carboxylic-acid synthase [Flavobacteriales bacterium]MEB2342006.1 2-succinyl-5-enolpyruvyl-6-hydroxy-3-cyclohexene-1-carboxylic-acid synthase [Flavobacteriia bacterium]